MARHPGRMGITGPVGLVVLFTFELGLASAPVRSCINHAGHTSHTGSASDYSRAPIGHGVSHPDASAAPSSDGSAPSGAGCDCLGLCQVELSPLVSESGRLAQGQAPEAPDASPLLRAPEPHVALQYPVPLARPPPTSA